MRAAPCGHACARRSRQVASTFASGYGDPWLTILGVISQPSANYNYDKTGTALPNGEPVRRTYATDEYEFYAQDSWRMRPNLTITGGVRYNLYSPPWEVDGLQLAPSVPLGQWFEQRRSNMLRGIGDNALPPADARPGGTGPTAEGLLRLGLQKFRAADRGGMTPAARTRGFLGWRARPATRCRPRRLLLLYDRVGFALATIFDEGDRSACRRASRRRFGTVGRDRARRAVPDLATLPPRCRRRRGRFPATPPIGNVAILQRIDDGITTPYHHVTTRFRRTRAEARISPSRQPTSGDRDAIADRRDLAMPMDLVDSKSGVNYFNCSAAVDQCVSSGGRDRARRRARSRACAPIAYWEEHVSPPPPARSPV